jgi:hypothetical protein
MNLTEGPVKQLITLIVAAYFSGTRGRHTFTLHLDQSKKVLLQNLMFSAQIENCDRAGGKRAGSQVADRA